MNTQKLKNSVKEKAFNFTKEEIEAIMDEELDKNPDEMDTELVEQCLAVLESFDEKENQPAKKKTVRVRKVLLIAAIIAVLVAVCIPVGADWINIDADSDNIQYVDGKFIIKEGKSESYDLEYETALYGFENAVYPRVFLSEAFEIIDVSYEKLDLGDIELTVEINGEAVNGYMVVLKYAYEMPHTSIMSEKYNAVKQTNINGVDVFVFSDKSGKECIIDYDVNGYNYFIWLNNCSMEDALKIAETIK